MGSHRGARRPKPKGRADCPSGTPFGAFQAAQLCLIVVETAPYMRIVEQQETRACADNRDVTVTASGLQKTAYLLLVALIIYVSVVGG